MDRTSLFGLGATPIDDLATQIQARVGEFLAAKQKLTTIVNTTQDLSIKEEATGLLGTQSYLEDQLAVSLNTIQSIKTSSYSISDIIDVGSFYAQMEKQLYDVDDLYIRYTSGPQQAGMSGFEYLILALIAGGMLYGITKRGR
jgi:hypothetical protein